MVLRKILWPIKKKKENSGDNCVMIHDLYSSLDMIPLMKSRWMIMVIEGKVSGTGNNSNSYTFVVGKPKG
jgi:hypothetical protein